VGIPAAYFVKYILCLLQGGYPREYLTPLK
jgi:hypothetical protein